MALERPFHDDVLAMTYLQPKKLRLPKEAERHLIDYRMKMRQARRFVIDDDMIDLTVAASMRLDKMELWIELARLPFDTCWIELDHHQRMRAVNRHLARSAMSLDETSREMGWLMVRDKTRPSRWFATEFVRLENDGDLGAIWPNPIMYVLDPEGDPIFAASKGVTPITKELRLPEALPFSLLGIKTDNGQIALNEWSEFRVSALFEPMMRTLAQSREGGIEKFGEVVTEHFMETQGVLRFLITLLAAVNDVPVLYREVESRGGSRRVNMKAVPYLDHTVVSIKAPKTKPIDWLTKKLDGAAGRRKRRHEVRGHWRTLVTKDRTIKGRVWISAHERGDASLGYVKHQYVVEPS